jgi:hypothetical protein
LTSKESLPPKLDTHPIAPLSVPDSTMRQLVTNRFSRLNE